jgi:hypothetical protein
MRLWEHDLLLMRQTWLNFTSIWHWMNMNFILFASLVCINMGIKINMWPNQGKILVNLWTQFVSS